MVELYRDENGVTIHGRDGRWRLYPVEYKLEQPDTRGADSLQLCAQVVRLEEMFVTDGSVKKFVSLEENDSFLVRITI